MKFTLSFLASAFAAASLAQGALSAPGDIAFTGFNADGNDNLSFVTFVDIPVSSTIYFTDEEWNGTDWAANTEHAFKWTSSAAISAGSIITLNELSTVFAPTPTASSNLGTISGFTNPLDTFNNSGLGNSNEAVYAYLSTGSVNASGVPIPTVFLALIANEDEAGGAYSLAGTGLSEAAGTAIVFTGDEDGMRYTGARSGLATFTGYLPLLQDKTGNWQNVGDGDGTTYVPFDATSFTVVPEPAAALLGTVGLLGLLRRRR